MNRESEPDHTVDRLVRAYLDQQASQLDPEPRIGRIHLALEIDRAADFESRDVASRIHSWRTRRLVAGLVAAAAVLLAITGLLQVRPRHVSAEEIVHQARNVHSLPMDRCYLVETRPAAGQSEENFPLISRIGDCQLWTRGDRFWIESAKPQNRWALGRDEQGSLWIAIAHHQGLLFGPDEIPDRVALRSDVLSVRLETLLGDVLRDFQVRRESSDAKSSGATTVILATPKPGRRHPILREARLEVEPETKVLRQLVLSREFQGRAFTTTFTLVDAQTRDDSSYQLEGHLEPDSPIYRRDHEPLRRRQLLLRFLGRRPGSGDPEDRPRENGRLNLP